MLPNDFDLQSAYLQSLSTRDAVVALFANLGYDTGARLKQTSAAMGFNEMLAHEITHIERIASHEGGELQVYLIEMKRVTVALTQMLARALRNRAGNFLLVLTADYERIDFVLMDLVRPAPASKPSGLSTAQAYLHPRVLTVDRRNPSPIVLRVLRRFSYTEIDVYYQLDKLRSAYGVAEWSEPLFNNRALFSDYYLNERLKDTPEWAEAERAAPVLRAFQGLMADVRQRVSGKDETTARTQLLEPALKALGFTQKHGKSSSSDAAEPDYLLFSASGQSKQVAFCDAYVWDRNLDGRDETRDTQTPDENPGALVVSLLERDVEQAPDWAIVTNGKTWRLYSRRAHSRATNYYEIDLEETIASADPGYAFRYFWLMFRAAAFSPRPVGEGTGERAEVCFLDRLLADSALYAKKLGERLKDRVFEDIFPQFAAGFIADIRAHEGNKADIGAERLNEVFHGTLTFLYRLPFLLYAESRDLLPVREVRDYHEISLTKLKAEISQRADNILDQAPARLEKAYSPTATGLYDRLMRLFEVIDEGDPAVNVPVYNGGLFITQPADDDPTSEAANARFLAAHKIPDRFLAQGLDLMARDLDAKTQALVPIDFKSLGVRQLGSIYEGLLEFKVRVAPEKMAVVRGKKTDEVIPYRQAEADGLRVRATLRRGEVYLENDRRERKATGSYYTPDYVVKYIVRNTVGPVLAEKFESLTLRIRKAEQRFQAAVQRKQVTEKVTPDRPALLTDIAGDVLRDLFDVKLLDPAMGSGHFLVEGVDYVTDRLVQYMSRFRFLSYFFEGTRRTILDEMERQSVTVDPARLTDVNLLKRHVLKRCMYGVDLNPMAVELAKVSLWLDCFTLGAPLSFLDHHLKCGNSLIGARIAEAREAVEFKEGEQMGLFASSQFTGIMLATDLMRHVGELSDVTAEQVRASRAEYRRAADALAPFKRIMDVYVSQWFGNAPTKAQSKVGIEPTIEFLRGPNVKAWLDDPDKGRRKLTPEMQTVAETALQAAHDKRFFHWELEFPEVFFGPAAGTTQVIELKANGGFDAVVGNPPYLLLQGTDYQSPLSSIDPDIFSGSNDISHFFLKRACQLAHPQGLFCFVVTRYWIEAQLSAGLRNFLSQNSTLNLMIDFGNLQVWPDVNILTVVALFERGKRTAETHVFVAPDSANLTAEQFMAQTRDSGSEYHHKASSDLFTVEPWRFRALGQHGIWEKVRKVSFLLDKITANTQGIKTGNNEAFTVASETVEAERLERAWLLPLAEAEDIQRYEIRETGAWVIYTDGAHDIDDAPKIRQHLLPYRSALSERAECNKGQYEWWRLQRARDRDLIHSPKRLLVPLYATHNRFFATERPLVGMTDVYIIVPTDNHYSIWFLSAVLNSSLLNEYHKAFCKVKRAGYLEYSGAAISNLPIRNISFTTLTARRKALVEQGRQLHEAAMQDLEGLIGLLAFVQARLSAQSEESDVVHDLLAYLAEQMIDLNKRKQAEQKRFLGWMEGTLKIGEDRQGNMGLDALTGKTTLRNYLGDYQKGEEAATFEAIQDVLFKNRNRIGVSLNDARFVARLKSEYDKSLGVLLPIKAHLARMDALIDQVVYRLYGLTEDEIAVVEGKR